jgi:hypothetical protein
MSYPTPVQHPSDTRPSSPDTATREPEVETSGPSHEEAGRLTIEHRGGRFHLHVDAPAHEGALISAALAEAKDALFQAGHPNVTWFDALTEVCDRAAGGAAPARRDRYRVYLHLDTEGAWVNDGPVVPPCLMRSLTCDGSIVPLWKIEGVPIAVGRARRVAPAHTRRIVADRDRGCRFPGCEATSWTEQHHIVHWADGGTTDPPNLISLCTYHHDAHHRGEYAIAGNADLPDALSFADRHGHTISLGRPRPPTDPLPAPPAGHRYQPPTGERFDHSLLSLPEPTAAGEVGWADDGEGEAVCDPAARHQRGRPCEGPDGEAA